MTQTLTLEQTLLEQFSNLTPEQQQEVITFIEFLHFKADHSEINEKQESISALESAGDLVGCLDSGKGNLSLQKKELKQKKLNEYAK